MLAITRLELRIAADVDELELEADLVLRLPHDLEGARAEVAVGGVIESDARSYGYRPLVVVASETRRTASP